MKIDPIYLFFLIYFSIGAILSNYNFVIRSFKNRNLFKIVSDSYLLFGLIFLIFFIGLRDEIGGDWDVYLRNYYRAGTDEPTLIQFVISGYKGDIIYRALEAISYAFQGKLYFINMVSSILFIYALSIFSRPLDNRFLFFTLSFPYLISIVAMGYSRQSIALAFLLIAYHFLTKNKTLKMFFSSTIAVLLHRASSLFLPLIFYIRFVRQKYIFVLIMMLFILLGYTYAEQINLLMRNYSSNFVKSNGVILRTFILASSGVVYFLIRNKFYKSYGGLRRAFFDLSSVASILLFLAALFLPLLSTAIDRAAIFFVPFGIFIFSSFAYFFNISSGVRILIILPLIIGAFLYSVLWAEFSPFSEYWNPYNNILFQF